MYRQVGLIVLLPLIGVLASGILGPKIRKEKVIGAISSGVIGFAFLIALLIFGEMMASPAEDRKHLIEFFPWIAAGSLQIVVGFQVDQLSILMTLIVTGVGFVIHVYSIGYMSGDKGFARFFAYLNLFIFAMLILVLADNFLLLFLGWEGVGLCSYLLIGFWYDKKFEKGTTSDAAKKAFIVNRVGDFGFLIGVFLIFTTFGGLSFETVFARAEGLSPGDPTILWITILLLVGCTGKSAQIPLHVWLPDAMAGPTPVSALIHAATMVTAGVYLVARTSFLFVLSPTTMAIMAGVAIFTALFAGSIGLVQNGIKKVLAYSTISQLGYMFLGLSVGAFASGIYHLVTHAFFKACLFLGAGAVIHAMSGEEDIRKMGGLKHKLPITYWTFLIASLAIAGFPGTSGFFSKDEILWKAFSQGSMSLWILGLLGAGLTAFYMFRLGALAFHGEPRWQAGVHPHEAPKTMTVPLVMLAFLSIVGGLLGVPASLGGGNSIEKWLEPVFEKAYSRLQIVKPFHESTEVLLTILSAAVALSSIGFALYIYTRRINIARRLATSFRSIYNILFNKYFIDEIYDAVFVSPTIKTSEKLLWKWFDVGIIDGCVNGVAKVVSLLSVRVRRMQTGLVQNYALFVVVGIVVILGWLILK
jgi:NADH-quinone oxidoreductase subunit L